MSLTRSLLQLPCPDLGGCIFAGIERDTRGTVLADDARFNYYPATPMVLISWIFAGSLHMVEGGSGEAPTRLGPALPALVFSGPQRRPVASWSPGPVHALSVAFFPEAIGRLLGQPVEPYIDRTLPLAELAPEALLQCCSSLLDGPASAPFARLQALLRPFWAEAHANYGGPLLGSWVRSLAVRAAFSPAGCSVRQLQRRIKSWTGQNHRQLQLFARVEEAFARASQHRHAGALDLAGLACAAGFSDQSHMGRDVRRVTGLSPAQFEEQIARSEAFWFYRLIEGYISRSEAAGN